MFRCPTAIVFVLFLLPLIGRGQNFLAIDHTERLSRFRVYPGEQLGIRMRGDRGMFRYTLEGIRGDTLFVSYADGARRDAIPFSSITRVRWYRPNEGGLLPVVGSAMQLGSVGWVGVRAINAATSGGDVTPIVPSRTAFTAAGVFAAGWLLNRTNRRTFRVTARSNWQLRAMDLGLKPANTRGR